jgi:hypothetical protein
MVLLLLLLLCACRDRHREPVVHFEDACFGLCGLESFLLFVAANGPWNSLISNQQKKK